MLSSAEELISPDANNDGTSRSSTSFGAGLMIIVECEASIFDPIAREPVIGSLPLVATLVSIDAYSSSSITDPSSST
jgi:hypothetical protein